MVEEISGLAVTTLTKKQISCVTSHFKIKNIKAKSRIKATFPYKNTISIILGVIRVYPELNKYQKKHKIFEGPIMELYDKKNETISYILMN